MDAEQITTVARGISEYGALAIIAAVWILFSVGGMVIMFRFIMSTVNSSLQRTEDMLAKLLDVINDVAEGLRPETAARVKNYTNAHFDLNKLIICRLLKRIRKENHISDREATAKKIRKLVRNRFDDRNSRFDPFTYRGHKLSYYTNEEWVEKVAEAMEKELYDESGENEEREYTNISAVYDYIKHDFYHRLNE